MYMNEWNIFLPNSLSAFTIIIKENKIFMFETSFLISLQKYFEPLK